MSVAGLISKTLDYLGGEIVKKLSQVTGNSAEEKKFRQKSMDVFSSRRTEKMDALTDDSDDSTPAGHVFCTGNFKVVYKTADYGNVTLTEFVLFNIWSDGHQHFVKLPPAAVTDYENDLVALLKK